MSAMRALVTAVTVVAILAPAGVAQGDDASGVVADLPWLSEVSEVSFDGRWMAGSGTGPDWAAWAVVDRATGDQIKEDVDGSWFVRDNPALRVNGHWEKEYPAPITLWNVTTGTTTRIDTDSQGVALWPKWPVAAEHSDDGDSLFSTPHVLISEASISRDGRMAAFCANYEEPLTARLYVKDLRTSKLTRTRVVCGATWSEYGPFMTRPPEMSADGRVVHVNGSTYDVPPDTATQRYWGADTLYFTKTGRTRTVNGWGSMTRDGSTIFMLIRARPRGTPDRTKGRVGAYDVRTGRTRKLGSNATVYGNPIFGFSAFERASWRGRYVVNDTSVMDRKYGIVTDISAILAARGYVLPSASTATACTTRLLSGDARVVVAAATPAGVQAFGCGGYVAITGWEPTARATMTTDPGQTRFLVNLDPDRASGAWKFRVQAMRADGSWRTLRRTYRTAGRAEVRWVDLPAGTYRVRVIGRSGYLGSISAPVALVN